MRTLTLALLLFILLASCIILPPPVKAESKTIIVPDDYPSLSSAIGNATGGDTIFIKKGTYEEKTIEINKTLTIMGEDMNSTIIKLHPPIYNQMQILTQRYAALSNAITVYANDFKLYNLTISNSPEGFVSIFGDRAQIVNNNVYGGSSTKIFVIGSNCNVTGNISGGGITVEGYHNVVSRNSVYAITVSKDSNEISNNTINTLELSNANQNIISYNWILSETASYGVEMFGNSSQNEIVGNNMHTLSNNIEINGTAVQNNAFYHNNFSTNYRLLVRIHSYNGTVVNFWDNGREGNFWADYNGTDSNGDGIGDSPYVIDANNVDRYPLMSPWTGSLPSPALLTFQTLLIAIIIVLAAVSVLLLIYFKKRKKPTAYR